MSTNCDCSGNITMLPVKGFGVAVDTDYLPKTDLSPIEERLESLEEDLEEGLKSLKKELEEALSLARTKATYQLCEFYSFRNPQKKQGFELAHGGLLENVADLYPEAWAFLQTDEGKALCVTEDEWQALNHATWATLADETKVGFDGIGGVPFYVQNLDAGTLRLPDIRGMYAEASGFDGLDVGGVHGDMVRKIYAETIPTAPDNYNGLSGSNNWHWYEYNPEFLTKGGAFSIENEGSGKTSGDSGNSHMRGRLKFDSSRVVPTGNANKPRAFGVLPCVYLGNSK